MLHKFWFCRAVTRREMRNVWERGPPAMNAIDKRSRISWGMPMEGLQVSNSPPSSPYYNPYLYRGNSPPTSPQSQNPIWQSPFYGRQSSSQTFPMTMDSARLRQNIYKQGETPASYIAKRVENDEQRCLEILTSLMERNVDLTVPQPPNNEPLLYIAAKQQSRVLLDFLYTQGCRVRVDDFRLRKAIDDLDASVQLENTKPQVSDPPKPQVPDPPLAKWEIPDPPCYEVPDEIPSQCSTPTVTAIERHDFAARMGHPASLLDHAEHPTLPSVPSEGILSSTSSFSSSILLTPPSPIRSDGSIAWPILKKASSFASHSESPSSPGVTRPTRSIPKSITWAHQLWEADETPQSPTSPHAPNSI